MSILASTSSASTAAGWGGMIIWLVVLFGFMYFFMIRPQAKKAKDQKSFLENLQKGDKVVTVAGIHGRINRINDNGTLEVQIDTNTNVVMERSGISMEYTKAIQQASQAPAKKD